MKNQSSLRDSGEERYLGDYSPAVLKGLNRRTATQEAAFFLPYLQSGMHLLDCGCGPGAITAGLAQVVAPGNAIGFDIAADQLKHGATRARDRDLPNLYFHAGNIYRLPFPDETFDAVFVHAVLYHLQDPHSALREVYRVLKPGGMVGARDTDRDGDIFGPPDGRLERAWQLLYRVHSLNGGNACFGKSLPAALHDAGFTSIVASASYDCYGTPKRVKELGNQLARFVLQPDMVKVILTQGWAERSELEDVSLALKEWSKHPGAFLARCRCEAVGWKA
jgi:ubiquinone/menaquinone biosynthesis C-methylase UbiE